MRVLYWDARSYPDSRYLHYLSLLPYEFFVPIGEHVRRRERNITCIPIRELRALSFDCAIFSSYRSFFYERERLMPAEMLRIPTVFVEHRAPRGREEHPIRDTSVLVVHVHPFHDLHWRMRATPSVVIEYGVPVTENHDPASAALFDHGVVRVPSNPALWDQENAALLATIARHALLDFVPVNRAVDRRYRYVLETNSSGPWLALLEGMSRGVAPICISSMPMAGLIENGISGFLGADAEELASFARLLQRDRELARDLGRRAAQAVKRQNGIRHFLGRWDKLLRSFTGVERQARENMDRVVAE